MKFILFLLVTFVVGCVFYGIAGGVQTVVRGAARLIRAQSPENKVPAIAPLPTTQEQLQTCLHKLQELHTLFQNGALSQEEFRQFKQYLLSTVNLANMPVRNPHE